MASVPGIILGATAVPTDSDDIYPITNPVWGKGGRRTVATTADRNAISIPRCEKGMQVHCLDTGLDYQLKDNWLGGQPIDSDWDISKTSTSSGSSVYYIDPAGSDATGDGTASNPWQTPQKAVNEANLANCFVNGAVTINCGAGLYNNVHCTLPSNASGDIAFVGDSATPSNVVFRGVAGGIASTSRGLRISVDGIQFDGFSTPFNIKKSALYLYNNSFTEIKSACISLDYGAYLETVSGYVTNLEFSSFVVGAFGIKAFRGCNLNLNQNFSITGAGYGIYADNCDIFNVGNITMDMQSIGGSAGLYLLNSNTLSGGNLTIDCMVSGNSNAGVYVSGGYYAEPLAKTVDISNADFAFRFLKGAREVTTGSMSYAYSGIGNCEVAFDWDCTWRNPTSFQPMVGVANIQTMDDGSINYEYDRRYYALATMLSSI